MKNVAIGFCAVLAVAVALMAFGDNVRQLFGASANALAGNGSYRVARETPAENFRGGDTFTSQPPSPTVAVREDPTSTFGMDVDTASYTYARRVIRDGFLPVPEAIRVEEWVNAFAYDYPAPRDALFAVHTEAAPSPFDPEHKLFLEVGLKARVPPPAERKPLNIVFLVDTSCSMTSEDRLPLAKETMKVAIQHMTGDDRVSLVTYAGEVRDVLGPTRATDTRRLYGAIDELSTGGGTAMGSGIELAYRHAAEAAGPGRVSRVVVFTDGDTNLGPNLTYEQILGSVKRYVEDGVTLSMVGFGFGNYRNDLMQQLADNGNGNCFYVDGLPEAQKIFGTQFQATMEVVAKDAKVQVEFNPSAVKSHRLLGYEKRALSAEQFRDDRVDSGDVGAGHTVTALYELELADHPAGDLGLVRIRAKEPDSAIAHEAEFRVTQDKIVWQLAAATPDFRFAAAVVSAAEILRGNIHAAGWSLDEARELAASAEQGRADRHELVELLGLATHARPSAPASPAPVDSY